MREEQIVLQSVPEYIKTCCKNDVCTKQAFLHYIDGMEVDAKKYVAADRISSLHVLESPRLISIWMLIRTDDLYETVLESGAPVDWFAFSVCSYIYSVGGFDKTQLLSKYAQWQSDKDANAQSYFNEFINIAINRLAVFYD